MFRPDNFTHACFLIGVQIPTGMKLFWLGLCAKLASLLSIRCPPSPAEQSTSSLHSAALFQEASCKSKEIIDQRELLVWVQECKARPLCFCSRSLSPPKTTKEVPEFLWSKISGLGLTWLALLINLAFITFSFRKGSSGFSYLLSKKREPASCYTLASSSRALPRWNPCK